ncbi:MAG: TIGR00725 family protein [Thermoanaerobaculia bacterium]
MTGLRIAVIGSGRCDERCRRLAFEVGREIGGRGVLLCGGGGGVMEAAAEGARSVDGPTVGIMPGVNEADSPPNRHIQLPIYTGIGQARNQVIVLSANAVVAVCGGWGTLNEISAAAKHGIPVVCLESWRLERPEGVGAAALIEAETPAEAVRLAFAAAAGEGKS